MGFSAKRALVVRRFEAGPRPLRIGIGVAAIIGGLLVIVRPTTSLDLLAVLIGIGAILEGVLALWETAASRRWRIITAILWVATGVVLLTIPWLTVWVLIVVVSLGLIVVGVARIMQAFRQRGRPRSLDERISSATLGVAAIGFGVVAFVWRDASMIILGVVFAFWLIITGVDTVWTTVRGSRRKPPRSGSGFLRRFLRSLIAAVAVIAAIATTIGTVIATRDSVVTDVFYAAPRDIPDEPGQLIRSEPFENPEVPSGARAWRILYTTNDGNGDVRVASALVAAPDDDLLHPSITWGHGTTGYAPTCAPSLQERPFKSGGMFALNQIIAEGWALVATDYPGLGTAGPNPYLVGRDSAYAMLDATRAATQLTETRISRSTVIWGHSQGGHAALWASQVAADYAPELYVYGTAAISPAVDLTGLVDSLSMKLGGAVLESFVLTSYSERYDDVRIRDYVRPGSDFAMRAYPQRCLAGPEMLVSVASVAARFADPSFFKVDPRTGPLGARLRENNPEPVSGRGLMIVTGMEDALISPALQKSYVDKLCKAGVSVDYRQRKKSDHISMLYGNTDFMRDLIAWTDDRFHYGPTTPTCN
ncbi:lipase family protein [Microbacterium gorillae]|uniref:lipase family protein n=1 Tax=Microbacterium gorillae TaxID=1231063 RepID=UPI000590F2F7|nr:lipase family protein [Microbacterium gorillae]